MLQRLKIAQRLEALLLTQALILVAVAVASVVGLNLSLSLTEKLNRNVSEVTQLGYMAETIRDDLLGSVRRVSEGSLSWQEGSQQLMEAERLLEQDWNTFVSGLTPDEREFVDDVLAPELQESRRSLAALSMLLQTQDLLALQTFLREGVQQTITPFLSAVLASSSERQLASAATFAEALKLNRWFLYGTGIMSVLGIGFVAVLGFLIYRSIREPIGTISDTVEQVTDGNYTVRCELAGEDELALLGGALDRLLEERVVGLARAEAENEQLNDSVLALLEAVDELSQRNLTVEVPVSPDVTGPVADAINKMSEEFSRVLRQVARIAHRVGQACALVNQRALAVSTVADAQREEVQLTATQLDEASKALTGIAETARQCSHHADETAESTGAAMEAVSGTLSGMREIRDSIQETSNRIKRLGDRSQEITGVVDIISTIAERTHMLALNASMQAASAGEAGRGFAVVADEVQRLAESSREATRQISSLVRNIQVDTNDTIVTMSQAVAQVVAGTRLAESANEQMANTRDSTTGLVEVVRRIATGSEQQSKISTALKDRSGSIVSQTVSTNEELSEQLKQTETLVHYAQVLNKAVRAFRLSAQAPS